MSDLLTDADLEELTALVQPAAQVRALREMGLRPFVRADGKPRITWAALTASMLKADTAGPDFGALRKVG